jgi:hypothetical protein
MDFAIVFVFRLGGVVYSNEARNGRFFSRSGGGYSRVCEFSCFASRFNKKSETY